MVLVVTCPPLSRAVTVNVCRPVLLVFNLPGPWHDATPPPLSEHVNHGFGGVELSLITALSSLLVMPGPVMSTGTEAAASSWPERARKRWLPLVVTGTEPVYGVHAPPSSWYSMTPPFGPLTSTETGSGYQPFT